MKIRIYYEDTDAAGVVYHAGYLKFFERARTEYFRDRGLGVASLAAAGYVFPVVRLEVDFRAPARHDDEVIIASEIVSSGASSITMKQTALRAADDKLLVEALVTLACIGPNMKARRVPPEVRKALSGVPCPEAGI